MLLKCLTASKHSVFSINSLQTLIFSYKMLFQKSLEPFFSFPHILPDSLDIFLALVMWLHSHLGTEALFCGIQTDIFLYFVVAFIIFIECNSVLRVFIVSFSHLPVVHKLLFTLNSCFS